MNEEDPINISAAKRGPSEPNRFHKNKTRMAANSGGAAPLTVTFTRAELNIILSLYGRHVAAGEWRDYAIDMQADRATFSVFRRASEMPFYRIEKDPKLMRKQGAFRVVALSGLVLKRGHDLATVLRVLEPKKHLAMVR